ncbi:hypothetical protein STEG23_025772 [Scotinomys teguina]
MWKADDVGERMVVMDSALGSCRVTGVYCHTSFCSAGGRAQDFVCASKGGGKWQENQISYDTATDFGGDNAYFNIPTVAVKMSKTSPKKCPPKYEVSDEPRFSDMVQTVPPRARQTLAAAVSNRHFSHISLSLITMVILVK